MTIFAEDYTKELKLDDVTIKIKKLSLKDQLEAAKEFNLGEESTGSLSLLTCSIVSWDAKDKDGKDVPLSSENIGRLRGDLVSEIIKEISQFNNLDAVEIKN
jgi:hypothetical protein